jgi:hypothetical protein
MTTISLPTGKLIFPHFTSSPKRLAITGTAGNILKRRRKKIQKKFKLILMNLPQSFFNAHLKMLHFLQIIHCWHSVVVLEDFAYFLNAFILMALMLGEKKNCKR